MPAGHRNDRCWVWTDNVVDGRKVGKERTRRWRVQKKLKYSRGLVGNGTSEGSERSDARAA